MFPSESFCNFSFYIVFDPFRNHFCLWCEVGIPIHLYPVVSEPFVGKTALSLWNSVGMLIKNQLTIDVWGFFLDSQFYTVDLYIYLYIILHCLDSCNIVVKVKVLVAQLCLLCNRTDCSPPVSSGHEIFQARVLEWGAIAFSHIYSQACLNH